MPRSTPFYALLLGATLIPPAAAAPAAGTGAAVQVYTSAAGTELRLTRGQDLRLQPGHALTEVENSVFVDPARQFQSVLGIGGAITDASAEVFAKLPQDKQAEFLKAYYDPQQGIGYTLARTTIHSSDFSSASYTYIKEGDKALKTFSIEHDRQYRIPLLKRAMAAAGGELTTLASPWSAPAFMKTNKSMLRGGSLLPEYADAWANYFTRFIGAYEAEGIPIWGVSLQNEPMAVQKWESMLYTAEQERDFLKNHLGPVMAKAGYGDKKIVVWDHNRDMMPFRAQVIFGDPEAARYAWGMGFHWYETWAGFDPMFDNVGVVHAAYPQKPILLTEASVEKYDPSRLQDWANGERYGRNMINDFNNGVVAWIDWNVLLDEKGGPNHVGNWCFAPLHADTRSGELIYTPSYYYIGHFSRFVRPQARRVSVASSRSNLLATGFVNADGRLATIVMNPTDKAITYNFYVGTESAQVQIPARAIQTLVQ
ncbi:MAG TPA: glycoside hydrolase family 30 protein [Stenotrophomonas sp.]|nr:glycoside hydrolase family 30 protein [Stenotrophomonas sp.]